MNGNVRVIVKKNPFCIKDLPITNNKKNQTQKQKKKFKKGLLKNKNLRQFQPEFNKFSYYKLKIIFLF